MVAADLLASFAAIAGASLAPAQMPGHSTVTAQEVKWGPAPPSIRPGAQAAVLYGDPNKEGMFVMRLKLPPLLLPIKLPQAFVKLPRQSANHLLIPKIRLP